MRIGIVGTENSHTDYYIRCLNQERRHGAHRIVALAGPRDERSTQLAATGGISEIVPSAADLIGRVDAAIVCSRDGRRHCGESTTLLDAGIPVLVDKPLACNLADAQAILDAARRRHVPVTSFSSLRWSELTVDLVVVSGPADPASEYAGIWYYGIHVAEIALALIPDRPITDVAVHPLSDLVVATARAGTTRLVLEFVGPQQAQSPPWRLITTGPDGSVGTELRLRADYAAAGVAQFIGMLDSGRPPLSEEQLLAPIRLLSAVADALPPPTGPGGMPVPA